MTNTILKGQKIRVFTDPLTESKFEGIAEVIEYKGATADVTKSGHATHVCRVRFQEVEPSEMDVVRLVTVENIILITDESTQALRDTTEVRREATRAAVKSLVKEHSNPILELYEALRRADKLVRDLHAEVRLERGGIGQVESSEFGIQSVKMIRDALDEGITAYIAKATGK